MSSSSPAARPHPLLGIRAVVTTSIPAGGFGEVRVPHRGGTETFGALGVNRGIAIPAGCRVTVIEVHPPRTLVVAADG
jgi:hypothetical protein